MAVNARFAPLLDPAAVARLRAGRLPVDWFSIGHCRACGPVLLPGQGRDYGELPECPWCLVRQQGGRLPSLAFVQARWHEDRARRAPAVDRAVTPVNALTLHPGEGKALEPPQPDLPVGSPQPDGDASAAFGVHRPEPMPVLSPTAHATPGDLAPVSEVGHIREVPHHPLDTVWIEAQVQRFEHPVVRSAVRRRYGAVYQAAFDAEPNEIRKDGKARFAANSDLREQVETVDNATQGKQHPHERF